MDMCIHIHLLFKISQLSERLLAENIIHLSYSSYAVKEKSVAKLGFSR